MAIETASTAFTRASLMATTRPSISPGVRCWKSVWLGTTKPTLARPTTAARTSASARLPVGGQRDQGDAHGRERGDDRRPLWQARRRCRRGRFRRRRARRPWPSRRSRRRPGPRRCRAAARRSAAGRACQRPESVLGDRRLDRRGEQHRLGAQESPALGHLGADRGSRPQARPAPARVIRGLGLPAARRAIGGITTAATSAPETR